MAAAAAAAVAVASRNSSGGGGGTTAAVAGAVEARRGTAMMIRLLLLGGTACRCIRLRRAHGRHPVQDPVTSAVRKQLNMVLVLVQGDERQSTPLCPLRRPVDRHQLPHSPQGHRGDCTGLTVDIPFSRLQAGLFGRRYHHGECAIDRSLPLRRVVSGAHPLCAAPCRVVRACVPCHAWRRRS